MSFTFIAIDDNTNILDRQLMILGGVDRLVEAGAFTAAEDSFLFLGKNGPVDIIFCDVEMDFNGLIAAKILKKHCKFLVFVTGHPKYFEESFKVGGLGFLDKPVIKKEVEDLLDKFEHVLQLNTAQEETKPKMPLAEPEGHILVSEGKKSVKLPLKDVIYMHLDGNYVYVYTLGKRYSVHSTLKEMEKKHCHSGHFYQIDRAHIIAMSAIKNVDGRATILLINGEKFNLTKPRTYGFFAIWNKGTS